MSITTSSLFLFCILFGSALGPTLIEAIQIRDCDPQKWGVEVEENSNDDPMVCDQFAAGDTVEWLVDQKNGNGFNSVGACPPVGQGSCPNLGSVGTLTRSGTSSSFTFGNATLNYGGYGFRCTASNAGGGSSSSQDCYLNIIYAARPGSTSCSITGHANGFISGSCSMTKVFSSANYYACFLRQGSATGSVVTSSNYSVQPISVNSTYYSGTWSYNAAVPTPLTTYTYVVVVYPGATTVTISLDPPSVDPRIVCTVAQNQFVAENSDLDCYCSASDLGHPQGRLIVYLGQSSVQYGSYGNGNVTFRVDRVNRTNVVRCELDWLTETAQNRNTVAYGPDSVNVSDPGSFDLDPWSSSNPSQVNLTCTPIAVQPSPTSFTWSRPCQSVTSSTCTFTPDVTNINDVINCTATNPVTGIRVTSNSVSLRVYTKPTILLPIVNQLSVNNLNSRVHLTIDLVALPRAVTFTIQPFGQGQKNSRDISNDDISTTCLPAGVMSYAMTCNITIDDVDANKEGGVYVLRIENSVGSTAVLFQIKLSETATEKESAQISVGAAVGVTIAVVAFVIGVVVAVVIMVLWKRHWVLPCGDAGTGRTGVDVRKSDISQSAEGIYEIASENTEATSVTNPIAPISTPGNYSTLQLSDIGLVSNYSEFTPYEIAPRRSNRATEHPSTSEYSN